MTFLEKLNSLPPMFCRYIARTKNGRRGLTTKEIESASGLSNTTVKELSLRTSWNNVTVETAQKFMSACGINPLAARKQRDFAKRRRMIHVENAQGAQKKLYGKIEVLLVEAAQKRTKQTV
jgi:hypothetical protein